MNLCSTLSRVMCFACMLTLATLVLVAPQAGAQINEWDHYKVYTVVPNPFDGRMVTLVDQFLDSRHGVERLEWFMNPTEKQLIDGQVFPILDPRTHYSWWGITPQPFGRTVAAINQFGDQMLDVRAARYLLNPALKNEFGPLPDQNHYKCYDCVGNPVGVPVVLRDQFGEWQTRAVSPKFFCTPVKKIHEDGVTFPIIDPNRHYVCYSLDPPDPRSFSASIMDQFLSDPSGGFQLFDSHFLCVPTEKVEPTPTRPETWGRLKILYR